jgi:ankyrin repeat protein
MLRLGRVVAFVLLALLGPVMVGRAQDIYEAAYSGNLKQVKGLLTANPELIDKPAESRRTKLSPDFLFTPLQAAAWGGRRAVVEWLLDHGADANATNEDGWTALHVAVSHTWSDEEAAVLVKVLLSHGADAGVKDASGRTALHDAAGRGLTKVVRQLLAHGAGADARDRSGLTPLHDAAWCGRTEIAGLLRKQGAQVDTLLACYFGDLERVQRFLKAEPTLASAADAAGRTLLHWAVVGGQKAVVEFLLAHEANPYARTQGESFTPLHQAVREDRRDLAALLPSIWPPEEGGSRWPNSSSRMTRRWNSATGMGRPPCTGRSRRDTRTWSGCS